LKIIKQSGPESLKTVNKELSFPHAKEETAKTVNHANEKLIACVLQHTYETNS